MKNDWGVTAILNQFKNSGGFIGKHINHLFNHCFKYEHYSMRPERKYGRFRAYRCVKCDYLFIFVKKHDKIDFYSWNCRTCEDLTMEKVLK